ncbi:MAG: hypothetical protein OXB90_09315 [Acidimicrobiaceae bacterium]|nr:hypothetical protein [Acidimicrobiaceae bacterium]
MRRGITAVLAVAIAVAIAAAGWFAGRQITSPEQAATEAEAPPASLITVEVERKELVADVIIRADVGYDEPVALRLSGAIGNRQVTQVVTSAPERGAELTEGAVAIEIAGRPVFLLVGQVPAYRDLRPQDQGPDIEQLESALARLGHFDQTPDQVWDSATGAAVSAWYEQAGYRANGPDDDEEFALKRARDRVNSARTTLTNAQKTLTEAAKGPTELALQQARTALVQAELALNQARLDLQKVTTDAADAVKKVTTDAADAVKTANDAVSTARQGLADSKAAVLVAETNLADAELARNRAANAYTQAQTRMQSATSGVHPDSGTVPTAAEQEELRLAVAGARSTLEAAERALENARQAVTDANWAVTEADNGLSDATDDLTKAQQDLKKLELPQAETDLSNNTENSQAQAALAVRRSQDNVAAAQQTLEDMLQPPDTSDAQEQVLAARRELNAAETDLTDLENTTGVWLPAGEIIFLKRLPVRVDLLTTERGSIIAGSFMTVTGSELALRGSVSERDVDRISEGIAIRIEDRAVAEPIEGTVRLLEQRAGTRNLPADRHYVELVADEIPDELVGRNVKVVIPVGGTDGPVLVVPNAALSATGDGSTNLEVEQTDGSTRFVSVEPGLSSGGQVEVTPLDGELESGDLVVVGVASGG